MVSRGTSVGGEHWPTSRGKKGPLCCLSLSLSLLHFRDRAARLDSRALHVSPFLLRVRRFILFCKGRIKTSAVAFCISCDFSRQPSALPVFGACVSLMHDHRSRERVILRASPHAPNPITSRSYRNQRPLPPCRSPARFGRLVTLPCLPKWVLDMAQHAQSRR